MPVLTFLIFLPSSSSFPPSSYLSTRVTSSLSYPSKRSGGDHPISSLARIISPVEISFDDTISSSLEGNAFDSYSYQQLERKRDSKIRKFRWKPLSNNCSTRLLVHRFKGKIGKISEERSGLAERLVRLLHSSSRPCRYRIVTRWTGDARKQGSSNGRVGIEIWYGQLSLARRGTRKASFHRAESGRIFALFASKTRGSLGDACPPPEKAFCFPTFPPLISLRLNVRGLRNAAFRLVKYSDGSIRTTWIYAQRSRQTRPDVSRRRGLVLNGKENRGGGGGMYRKHPVDAEKLVAVGRIVGKYFTATWEDRFVRNEFGKIKKNI